MRTLGLKLIQRYRTAIEIKWKKHTFFASALYEDREGIKRFLVKRRDKKSFYPKVVDCSAEEGEQDELPNL